MDGGGGGLVGTNEQPFVWDAEPTQLGGLMHASQPWRAISAENKNEMNDAHAHH